MGYHKMIFSAGTIIVLFTSALLFGGCANTMSETVSLAQEIHSLTPCGMMMEKMMEHGQAAQIDSETHQEPEPETIYPVNQNELQNN